MRTLPLPLEILFRPDIRGTYDTRQAWSEGDKDTFTRFEFRKEDGGTDLVADPWTVRNEFLENENRGGGLIGMTLAYGRFGVGIDDLLLPTKKLGDLYMPYRASRLLDVEFKEWQRLFRAGMRAAMSEWPTLKRRFSSYKVARLCAPLNLVVEWRNGRPIGVISCSGVLQAVIATLQVDAVIGAEYRFCACVGCPRSFKAKRRDQRYCGDDCKHKQVVRNGRERKRKALLRDQSHSSERKTK